MKPCSNNRKLIAWLALDALDASRERDLRAHLKICEGCRGYLEEISSVTEKLAAAEIRSDIRTSETFHQKVVGRLGAESVPGFEAVLAHVRAILSNWRVALPVIGATVLVLAALFFGARSPTGSWPAEPGARVVSVPSIKSDLDPTLSNYQMVA